MIGPFPLPDDIRAMHVQVRRELEPDEIAQKESQYGPFPRQTGGRSSGGGVKICVECGGRAAYDSTRDELVCSGCGLTDIIDSRDVQTLHRGDFYKTAFDGIAIYTGAKPSEYHKPKSKVMYDGGGGDVIFYQKTEERRGANEGLRLTNPDYMPVYSLDMEPEETADGDEADVYGSISLDTLLIWKMDGSSRGGRLWNAWKEARLNEKTGRYRTFWRYTHSEIPDQPRIRTILKNKYWVACNRLDADLSPKEAKRAAKRCNKKATCRECVYRMDLSFKDRERGRLWGEGPNDISQIDRRFSWPYQCLETFTVLKPVYDNNDLLATDGVLSEKHKILNKIFQDDIHYEHLPIDPKTIKRRRATWARSIPAYGDVVYSELPIGKLLKDTEGAGYSAVWCLAGFGALAPMWEIEPTRSNLIEWFKDQDLLDYAAARKNYDLLIKYGVIHRLERFHRTGLLYLRRPGYYKSE